VYEQVVTEALAADGGRGPLLAYLGSSDPGGPRRFDPSGVELRVGDALALLPEMAAD